MNSKDAREFLRDDICEVLFEKRDGTERLMKCTLNFDHIPEEMKPLKGLDPKKVLDKLNILRVFDIDKQGWRSFDVENIKYIKIK